jgi:hypothetical protein
MGLKLVTFYRKIDEGDTGHQALLQQAGAEGGDGGEEAGPSSQVRVGAGLGLGRWGWG